MSILLLVATCIATGLAVRLLRALPRLVFMATIIGTAVLVGLLATASSEPVVLIGRSLRLESSERIFLWPAIGLAAALAFFGPLTFEQMSNTPAAILSNSQGSFFFWSLSALVVAMAIDNFPLAVFFWAVGLILLMLVAQPRRQGRVGGAAQFLLLTVIATASLLLANRFFSMYPLTPENLDLVRSAFLFLAWGMGLLLAVAPFHIWLGPLADEMPLLGMAFLVGVAQPVGLWLLLQLMSTMSWLPDKSPLLDAMLLGGIITVPVGAIMAVAERRQGRFLAHMSLVSLGHVLIGLGLGTRLGLVSAMIIMLNRGIGVTLLAGGFTFILYHVERRWQLIGMGLVLAGGMALSGLAFVPTIPARWGIYQELADMHPVLLGMLLISSIVAFLAVIRHAQWILCQLGGAVESTGEVKIVPYMCTAVAFFLIGVLLIGAIFPQLIGNVLLPTLGTAGYLK